jgi:hypothetical protein
MRFQSLAFGLPLAALLACGNGGGGSGGGTSTGGSGGATTSTTSSSTTSTASTTTSTTSSSSSVVLVPSGLSCSGNAAHLAADVVPVMAAHCASGYGCHAALGTAAGIMDQLVGRVAEQCSDLRLMIAPGDPERSYVVHKMTDHNLCGGQTMPKDLPLMDGAPVQVVYDWICAGALND